MSRSRQPNQSLALPEDEEMDSQPNKCVRFLCFLWRFCTCVFSHVLLVSLVVSYCFLGAFTFVHLEAENEVKVKNSIADIRGNVSEDIWKLTKGSWVLHQENWTYLVTVKLKDFEKDILASMKQKGWDGNEDPESIQWTFAGALFFSIIVITTIGYGHIAPKTHMGKVVTIFYAILGIPLMLLCLSNIGDVMATSFRFLYWRVCCYVCTRKPKRRRHRSRGSTRQPNSRSVSRNRGSSGRKPIRYSEKSNDSGFPRSDTMPSHSYSDTDLRYPDEMTYSPRMRNLRISQMSRFSDSTAPYAGRSRGRGQNLSPNPGRGLGHGRTGTMKFQRSYSQNPPPRVAMTPSPRGSATDRRQKRSSSEARYTEMDDRFVPRSSMFFNKYATDDDHPLPKAGRNIQMPLDIDLDDDLPYFRSKSVPRPTRRDFFLDDDLRSRPRRDRSPKYDMESDFRTYRDYNRRDYTSNRDIYGVRDFMDGEDLHRERRFGYSLDLPERRYRQRRSPEPGRDLRDDRMTSLDRKSRSRFEIYNDDDPENNPYYDDDPEICASETELQAQRLARQRRRDRQNAPSARIMSPMGIAVHRQAKYMDEFDIEYAQSDEGYYNSSKNQIKPVPIWLCVFLVVSYIIAGAFLFSQWEEWPFLESAYFCFITLTTIGFGDLVPSQGVKENSEVSIALCSLYLLFGISLLAMSFNLVQEEVIANVRSVAKRLGIIKPELGEESDED